MSDINIILTLEGHENLRLRSVNRHDLEDLRNWKNNNKNSFFLHQDITREQQQKWFLVFSTKEYDHMFIVEQQAEGEWKKIGCMGFRRIEEEGCVDAYNIIRSLKIEPASFTMSDAFRTMLVYANSIYPDLPLQVKVLVNNPAVAWYKMNEFTELQKKENYVLMQLNLDSIRNLKWSKQN
jgi:hypothetical protein